MINIKRLKAKFNQYTPHTNEERVEGCVKNKIIMVDEKDKIEESKPNCENETTLLKFTKMLIDNKF